MASGILSALGTGPITRKRGCESRPKHVAGDPKVRFRPQGKADLEDVRVRARLNRSHKVLIAVVAAITMLLLLAVAVRADDDSQKDQIASGIKIGGVDVGGGDADSARKIIKRQVVAPLQQPVVVAYEGKDYTLSAKSLNETADVDAMVQEAIDRSREGGIVDRVTRYATGGEVNADLEPRVAYDNPRSRTSSTSSPNRLTRSPWMPL